MNIGGHGTGGSLAQHLINELATYQAAQKHEQSLIEIEERKSLKDKNSASVKDQTEHNENPTELEKQLQETIETQLEYELENGKKITNVEKKQDQIKDYTIKHLLKTKAYLDQIENNQLGSIKHFTLTTTNSGGVPTKVRNNFIQSLALLKQSDSTTTPFNVKCNKIMVGGDPVQQTGATDLAAYIPPDLMPTSLIKIDSGKEGTYKKNLLQIAKSTALIIVQAVLAAKGIILPINPISQAQNIKNNTGKLVSNARHAHRDCYFDKTDDLPNYTIMSNASNDPANYQLNQELSTKIPVFTNGYYKKFKKMAYSMCGIISEKLHKVKEKTTPVITTVDNLPNSIHTQQAKQLMDHIKNIGQSLVDDPRGRTKLITSSREKLLRKVVTPAQKRIAPDKPSLDNL